MQKPQLLAALFALTPVALWATPSGLNNIPTADTTPQGTLVGQVFGTVFEGGEADLWAGFKTGFQPFGPLHRFEFGLDSQLDAGAGPIVGQVKYAVQPWEEMPTFAIGVANAAFNDNGRDEVGYAFLYGVLTQDFGFLRGHLGYGNQDGEDSFFVGLDKTFKVWERDLMLRSDLIQINDGDDLLGSFGFLYAAHENIVIESWASKPTNGGDASYALKLNFVFNF